MSKKYCCDGGTIMIGTKESRVCFPNGYGDGEFSVKLVRTKKQRECFANEYKKWQYLGVIEGKNFYVWSYDCLLDHELNEEHILYTLSGRYAVFRNNGKIVLEKR